MLVLFTINPSATRKLARLLLAGAITKNTRTMSECTLTKFIARRNRYQEWQSNLFHLNRPEALKMLYDAEVFLKAYAKAKSLCMHSKIKLDEGLLLADLLDLLVEKNKSMSSEYGQYFDELEAINQVGAVGLELLKVDSFFNKLTGGFLEFMGGRRYIRDDDFGRRSVFWLDRAALDEFDQVLCGLSKYGRWEPWNVDKNSNSEQQLDSLQRIFVCFGIGASQMLGSTVMIEVPEVLGRLYTDCKEIEKVSTIASKLAISSIQQDLEKVSEEFHVLVEAEERNGSKFVALDGVLLTKPFAKHLREVIDSLSRLLNAS